LPHLATAGVTVLAAAFSILLWTLRGSVRGAGIGTLIIAALPGLIGFARNARSASYGHDPGFCGPAWFGPLFYNFVLVPCLVLPILAVAVALLALAAARLAWARSRRSAGG